MTPFEICSLIVWLLGMSGGIGYIVWQKRKVSTAPATPASAPSGGADVGVSQLAAALDLLISHCTTISDDAGVAALDSVAPKIFHKKSGPIKDALVKEGVLKQ